jgi:hypothetical protein
MLVARIEEQLSVRHVGDDLPSRIDVAFVDEERIVVGAVDLDRHALRPRPEGPFAADRDARVEQERPTGPRASLGELLGDRLAEREAGIHEVGRQVVGDVHTAFTERVEALLLDERHALRD